MVGSKATSKTTDPFKKKKGQAAAKTDSNPRPLTICATTRCIESARMMVEKQVGIRSD